MAKREQGCLCDVCGDVLRRRAVVVSPDIYKNENRMSPRIPACLSLAAALLLGGCSGRTMTQSGERPTETTTVPKDSIGHQADGYSHVIDADTDYYTTGPQQGRPPDGKFSVGTKVNVVQEADSYTLVRTERGVEAYVPSDAVKKIGD